MPWRASVPADLPVIESFYSGLITAADLALSEQQTTALLVQHDRRRLLADCTALEGVDSALDMHALAEMLNAKPIAHEMREAMILPTRPEVVEMVVFWETLCRNRGLMVRSFPDRAQALAWLLGKAEPDANAVG